MIPNLRFPEYESTWKRDKLGSLVFIITDYVASGSFASLRENVRVLEKPEEGSAIYVRLTDLRVGLKGSLKFVDPESYRFLSKSNLHGGELLMANIGANVGDVYLMPKIQRPATIAPNMLVIRENKEILLNSFLYQFLKGRGGNEVQKLISGSGQPKLSKTDLKSAIITFPKLDEQIKIANLFSLLDQKINLLTKRKEALETYKKGLMQKIFSQELRFKREDGTDYPEWTSTKIGNHTFKVSEKNKNLEPLPIYSISNKGGFVPQSEQFEGIDSSERGYDISMYKIVGKDTFAYNPARINVGSYGYSANLDRVQVSSLYVCFKVKPELSPIYLLYFMSSFKFNKSVLRNVEGGVRQYLFYDNFKNIGIPLPSLIEQEKIIQALKLLDGNLGCLDNAINKTQELKKGLLQQMFA